MSDELIRAELFSAERLEQHAQSLAAAQPVVEPQSSEGGGSLARRLRDNSRLLVDAHQMLGRSAAHGQPMTPAAEWLVDNYHVIHAQVRQIRDDLPPGYYRQLPKLAAGPFAGFPRVLGIAWAFVAHTDSRFDPETTVPFVRAYQRVQPLTIGELWAMRDHAAHRAGRKSAPRRESIVENRAARAPRRHDRRRDPRHRTGRSRADAGGRASRFRRGRCIRPSPCNWCSACATRTRR